MRVFFFQQRDAGALSVRTADWRLITQLKDNFTWPLYPQRAGQGELYDLRADPGAVKNLWPATAGKAQRMQEDIVALQLDWEGRTLLAEGLEIPPLDAYVEEMLRKLGY